jgi:predicted methyltransferase
MKISSLSQRIVPGLLAGLCLFGSAVAHADSSLKEPLTPILADGHRSEVNRARDAFRHPVETLSFFGVKPNQTVIEVTPAPGWYTEVLAPLLKPNGQYIAALMSPEGLSERGSNYAKKRLGEYQDKLTKDAAHYDKVKVVQFVNKSPSFGPDGSADVVLTFRNVHNWVDGGTHAAMFKAMFAVLKPGGVLGVVDHRADKKNDFKKALELGYLPEDYVIAELEKVGFKLDAKSDVNNNPKDTKDYEQGVWTLPPVLALKDVNKAKYLAIGESDRFTLRFVKPK